MTENKAPDYDYAIFFRLAKEITEQQLKSEIRAVKNRNVPGGERDFYIAFDEPEIDPNGITEGSARYRMKLHGVTDPDQLDSRVRPYNPTHYLTLRQLQPDANFLKVTDLAIALYDEIGPGGRKYLDSLVMHLKDKNQVMPV